MNTYLDNRLEWNWSIQECRYNTCHLPHYQHLYGSHTDQSPGNHTSNRLAVTWHLHTGSHFIADLTVGSVTAAVTWHTGQALRQPPVSISALITQISQYVFIGAHTCAEERTAAPTSAIRMALTCCMKYDGVRIRKQVQKTFVLSMALLLSVCQPLSMKFWVILLTGVLLVASLYIYLAFSPPS